MYKEHPVFEKPINENARIWRYLDFAKFVSILEKKALFFVRADKLGDPFEGSYSKANIELRPRVYGQIPEKGLRKISEIHERFRRFTLINCWSVSDYESEALWKLYLKSENGIAVQSTFKRLAESFRGYSGDVHIGMVKYADYQTEWIPEGNSFYPFLHKRRNFAHESELRAVIQRIPIKQGSEEIDLEGNICDIGIYVPVDLDILIEKIIVSPSETWFIDLVKAIVTKYTLDKEVLPSSLAETPVY
ncbi:MAG: hypothetical protein ABSG57_11090 [Candidatus Bathyarchaeia archaeon]